MTVSHALLWAANELNNNLEAEVLLAHALQVPRAHFYTHPERELTAAEEAAFKKLIQRKAAGEPTAYLTGQKEFWSLNFIVTNATLIPRPETELLVELVLKQFGGEQHVTIADLGTGSGAIALALAHEKPGWDITATDLQTDSLAVAKTNAERLNTPNVIFNHGDWCDALSQNKLFDVIISNPPYIAKDDEALQKEVAAFEPHTAFLAEEHGLADLCKIITSAKKFLKPSGFLYLEHGAAQASAVHTLFTNTGYREVKLFKDYAGLDRVTRAQNTFGIAS